MKISVLIPSRGGGEYLGECLNSALDQADPDFEVVVVDNANVDRTRDVLERVSDNPLLRVVRSEIVLPVDESWNLALAASSGDYVVIVGDDDLLLPSFLKRLRALLESSPDCVTYNAMSFVVRDSIGGSQGAYFARRHFRFDDNYQNCSELPPDTRVAIVRDMFQFRIRFPLNMQTTAFSRQLADRLPSPMFQPPFPDHLAIATMLLEAERWLVCDEELVIIGVSPKSFGHYVYSGDEVTGSAYLGVDTGATGDLPGSPLVNGMHAWLTILRSRYPHLFDQIKISRRDYVARQIWSWMWAFRSGAIGFRAFWTRLGLLSVADWIGVLSLALDVSILRRVFTRSIKGQGLKMAWPQLEPIDGVETIGQFSDWLNANGERGSVEQ